MTTRPRIRIVHLGLDLLTASTPALLLVGALIYTAWSAWWI